MIDLSKITDGGKIKMLYCPQAPATVHQEKEPSETLKSSLLETEFKPPVWNPSPRYRRPWLRRAFAPNRAGASGPSTTTAERLGSIRPRMTALRHSLSLP